MPRALFLFLLSSTAIFANVSEPWSQHGDFRCADEFKKMALEQHWDKEGFREHVGPYNKVVYRNLSQKIGEWVELQLSDKASPEIYVTNDALIAHNTFDKSCKFTTVNEPWPYELERAQKNKMPEDWGNADLKKLVGSGKTGVIYYWSPRFTYSVLDLPRMEKLAKRLGLEFISVVDPRASKAEILGALSMMEKKNAMKSKRALASRSSFYRNLSTDLYMRSGFNHFPVSYIYNNQKIHSRFITGIMTDGGFKSMAENYAGELK